MKFKQKPIGDQSIYYIDGLLSKKEIDGISNVVEKLPFVKAERSHAKDEYLSFRVDFLPEKFEDQHRVGIVARSLLMELYPDLKFKLWRAYINMTNYGDVEYPHFDCSSKEKDITVLYYAHNNWDKSWGGEILFYKDDEAELAITPIPGRFLIFPGVIQHVGTVPSRICKTSRFSFAMKYKLSDQEAN